jgi:23S rRNA pseudouridine1911/1915/1917 synthase
LHTLSSGVPWNRGWSYTEQIGAEASGSSVLAHLTATRSHSSEAEWTARIERGEVEVEGAVVRSDAILQAGQMLVWHRPPWEEPEVPTSFELLHEDQAIVVVRKPSGLPTMPAGGFLDNTLLSLLRERYPEAIPLHRLGRHTSGIVLFARSRNAASALAREWREHRVKKVYRALAAGTARKKSFDVDVPIGPVPHPILGSVHATSAGGKPSHSAVTVLEQRACVVLLRVEITTGRPHQIRIHMAAAGHPLVGDAVYAPGGRPKAHPGLPGDGGYFLHAEQLELVHPVSGERVSFCAIPPPELRTKDEL